MTFFIIHLVCFVASVGFFIAGVTEKPQDRVSVGVSLFGMCWNVAFGVIALLPLMKG